MVRYHVAHYTVAAVHRFAEAKMHLAEAHHCGAPVDVTSGVLLSIKQALGEDLQEVLEARRRIAETSSELQELVPLGALLADLGEFEEADRTYLKAIQYYRDVSPFALAWVCFQLGVLWGETVRSPNRAARQIGTSAPEGTCRRISARVSICRKYISLQPDLTRL